MKKLSILALMVPFVFLFASCDSSNNKPDNQHEHSFVLNHDENNHWLECSCKEKKDIEVHDYGDLIIDIDSTEESTGIGHYKCKTCGYENVITINKKDHQHHYSICYDENNHWLECSCGDKKETEEHEFDPWQVDIMATLSSDGKRHRNCKHCDYTETKNYCLYSIDLSCDTSLGTVDGTGEYAEGDLVSILATPKENYIFMGWYNGDSLFNKNASLEFNIENDITLTAKFEKDFTKLTYELSSDESYYLVTGIGTYPFAELVIPGEYNGKPVKEIKSKAFLRNEDITSIRFLEGVEKIGPRAFDSALNLEIVTFPNSLISIGSSAFESCRKIEELEFNDNLETIESAAFFTCTGLKSLTIPASVTSIGGMAFYDCYNLESIVVEPNNTVYDSRDNSNALIETNSNTLMVGCKNSTIVEGIKRIESHAFENIDILTINLPNGLESIGDYAFYSNLSVTTIVMPNTLTRLGEGSFKSCAALSSVTLSSNLESLPEKVFSYCTSLTSLLIPSSVTSIGPNAFENAALSSVTIPNSVRTIGKEAFKNSSIQSLVLSNTLDLIDERVFSLCASLGSVVIPNSVTNIKAYAFNGCRNLKKVTIGSGVSTISNYAFAQCYKIETIIIDSNNQTFDSRDNSNAIIETATNRLLHASNKTIIPNSIVAIAPNAFWYTSIEEIILPESLLDIENFGFDSTTTITSLIIPDSVKHIGYGAICFCNNLEYVVIGSGVEEIEATNFFSCNKLDTIYYKGDSETWNQISKVEDDILENITIYYYSETAPTTDGNFWHYVEGVITVWE